MPKPDFPFEARDRLIRRITAHNRNSSGRPSRGAFKGRNGRTSVFLERLLLVPVIPKSQPDDHLAFIRIDWIFNQNITINPLKIEHTDNAHFDIIGDIHIEFADFLRDEAERISLSEWVANYTYE